jgi:5'-deoxynucleotidase
MRLDKTFGLLSGLSGTYRFSNAKLVHRESVLEHLGGVALTCFLIYNEIVEIDGLFKTKVDLDIVMAKAITHDVEELLLGDIPRTTKYANKETTLAIKMMETAAMDSIFDTLELDSNAIVWNHAQAKKETSGLIVKIADALAVVYKIHEEAIERGNRSMMSRASSVTIQLNTCVKEIDANADLNATGKAFLVDLVEQAEKIIDDASTIQSSAPIEED